MFNRGAIKYYQFIKRVAGVYKFKLFGGKILSTKSLFIIIIPVVAFVLLSGNEEEIDMNTTVLLETIAKGESSGNYNAYYGNAKNTSIEFTSMEVHEVLAWQRNYVKKGSPSSAVGKYQFIRPTLQGLVDELEIDRNARFDQRLQDKLAVALLERRGLSGYGKGEISRKQFAHNLSKEWAALPRVTGKNPRASYYAGDGLNKVRISIDEIYTGIASLHQ